MSIRKGTNPKHRQQAASSPSQAASQHRSPLPRLIRPPPPILPRRPQQQQQQQARQGEPSPQSFTTLLSSLPLPAPPVPAMAGLLHLHSTLLPSASLLRQRGGGAQAAAPRRRRACRVEAKIREIFMPALSSTMTEGKIVAWNAAEGDRLSKGDPVVVVESDKADMDVETFHDGFLAAVLVPAGESAPVGSAIALLAESEEEIPLARSQAANLSSAASPPAPQETVAEEASPATPPPPPPAPVAVSAPAPPSPATQGGARVVASPYAKKLAKDLSVDLFSVTGSGPGGRVVAKDVEAAAAAPKKAVPVAAARPDVPLGSTVPFTTMQGAVSKNMVESLAVPTFRVGYAITTDALDQLYKKIKAKGVTMTALLAKATAMALVQHPVVNSSCRDGQSFTYNSSINIAVAVAIDGGLITPVLQDADKLDIYTLSRKWKELVEKARAKQLQPQEYNSGCTSPSL
uniref:Uncharacterized protein n=1 Tax=Avena sativa TaxID=4498 RepID=A0ACD5XNV5_AVESA